MNQTPFNFDDHLRKKFKTLEEQVKVILEKDYKSRDIHELCYIKLLELFYGIQRTTSFSEILLRKDLPSLSSVTRAVRKVQEKNQFYRGDKRRKGISQEAAQTYREVMPTI